MHVQYQPKVWTHLLIYGFSLSLLFSTLWINTEDIQTKIEHSCTLQYDGLVVYIFIHGELPSRIQSQAVTQDTRGDILMPGVKRHNSKGVHLLSDHPRHRCKEA